MLTNTISYWREHLIFSALGDGDANILFIDHKPILANTLAKLIDIPIEIANGPADILNSNKSIDALAFLVDWNFVGRAIYSSDS